MQLTFETMDELREMIAAMGYVHRSEYAIDYSCDPRADLPADVAAAAAMAQQHMTKYPTTGAYLDAVHGVEAEQEQSGPVGVEVPAAGEPTKRKRRTKAEIEAAAAAVMQEPVVKHPTHGEPRTNVANPLDNLKPEVEQTASPAHAEITEMAGLFDGNDKLAHLNEGRAFIEKYTFPVYNETLMLADVPANIAAHTPEQVSRHRAAMAWLAAQKAG